MSYKTRELKATYKSLRENRARLAKEEMDKILAEQAKRDQFVNNYNRLIDRRDVNERMNAKLMESARNDAFAVALKAMT